MKPSSLVAVIARLVAIYLVTNGAVRSLFPSMVEMAFRQKTPAIGSQIQVGDVFSGLFGLQITIAAITIVIGILLYIWSVPLGRLIARGVEE